MRGRDERRRDDREPGRPGPRRRGRRGRPPLWSSRSFPPFAESLEDRTLLATSLTAAQVQALAGTVNDGARIGGGLNVLQEWAGKLDQSSLFGATLPIVDQSLGQLLGTGAQVGSELAGPAAAYLTGAANPTAEGLVSALIAAQSGNGATGSGGDTFSASNGVYTFTVPTLSVSSTVQVPVDFGTNASLLNLNADRSQPVSLTTTLNLNLAFRLDTTNGNAFAVAINPSSLVATIAAPSLNLGVNLGIMGGQVTGGSLSMTAGLDFRTAGAVSIAQLFGSADNPASLATVSASTSSNLTATLPISFTFNGQNLSGTPLPTVTITDPRPFDGKAPAVSTANFANLVTFSNLTPTALLADLTGLGGAFAALSGSPLLATPLPFTNGVTVGSVLDFGKAFADKLITGLTTLPTPASAPTVAPTGGGSAGGLLAAGTYFVVATYANAYGQSAPSAASSPFTVAAGQVPSVALPKAPAGFAVNLYLSDATAAAGSARLHASGLSGASAKLAAPRPAGGAQAPTAATRTPLFGSAQTFADLLSAELTTTPGSPFQVHPTFTPKSATNPNQLTFQVSFDDQLAPLVVPLGFDLDLGPLGGIKTAATLEIMPAIHAGLTFGINLDPSAASLVGTAPADPSIVGGPLAPIPTTGQLGGDASFTLAVGANPAVSLSLPNAATSGLTSVNNPANPLDPATLVGQLNLALGARPFGAGTLADYVRAGVQNGNVAFALARFDQGNSLKIGVANGSSNPMGLILGFSDGQKATLAPASGPAANPLPANGRLGADSTFTLTIGSTPYTITLPRAATDGDGSISNPADANDPATLVGQINKALTTAGIGAQVVAGFQNGNVSLTLRAFDLGTSLKLDCAATDPMATVLGFSPGGGVHAHSGDLFISNASATGSVNLAVSNAANAPAFATASVGPLSMSIGQATFSAAGSVAIAINGGNPINLGDLAGDFQTLDGIKSVVSVTPSASFSANFTGFTVAAGDTFRYTPTTQPSLTVTALDPLDGANQLAIDPATRGRLGADLYFQVKLGSAPT